MKSFFKASGFVLFWIYTSLSFAETPPVIMAEEVVVTAERIPQKLRDTIQHTTVITSKDITRSQAVDVPTSTLR